MRILRDRWGVPHIHGATAEAEAPAREAAEVFQAAQARESQVRAWVVLGRSLVGQGKPDLAQSEIERATRLAAKSADIVPRLQAATAATRVQAVRGNAAAATRVLSATIAGAKTAGLVSLEVALPNRPSTVRNVQAPPSEQ